MRLQFDRTTIIFLVFVIILAAIFGIQQVVQRQPPHEIMCKPLSAWELAAFAASCRNGLVTLLHAQSDRSETSETGPR